MDMRRITSLTAFLTFFVLLLTSVVLYICPSGRIAYWADWRLWGLSKGQWAAIHINVGLLFGLSLLLHIYYNWTPIVRYMQNRLKQLKVFTKDFNVAAGLTLLFIIGTYADVPPFSTVIDLSDGFKDAAAVKYGEPPYGHAERSSLKVFARKVGIDLRQGIALLEQAGYRVDNQMQTVLEVANTNGTSPHQLYLAMIPAADQPAASAGHPRKLPERPVPGVGNLPLVDFCRRYELNVDTIIKSLEALNIEAQGDMSLKKIAEINQRSPADIYEQIATIVDKQGGH